MDNWVYKLNPHGARLNFPRDYKHKGRSATMKEKELRRILHLKYSTFFPILSSSPFLPIIYLSLIKRDLKDIYPEIAADTAIEEDAFDPTQI